MKTTFRCFFHAIDNIDRDQRIAVHTQEFIREFHFQVFQRLLNQYFTILMSYGDVFLIRIKIINIDEWDQFQISSDGFLMQSGLTVPCSV